MAQVTDPWSFLPDQGSPVASPTPPDPWSFLPDQSIDPTQSLSAGIDEANTLGVSSPQAVLDEQTRKAMEQSALNPEPSYLAHGFPQNTHLSAPPGFEPSPPALLGGKMRLPPEPTSPFEEMTANLWPSLKQNVEGMVGMPRQAWNAITGAEPAQTPVKREARIGAPPQPALDAGKMSAVESNPLERGDLGEWLRQKGWERTGNALSNAPLQIPELAGNVASGVGGAVGTAAGIASFPFHMLAGDLWPGGQPLLKRPSEPWFDENGQLNIRDGTLVQDPVGVGMAAGMLRGGIGGVGGALEGAYPDELNTITGLPHPKWAGHDPNSPNPPPPPPPSAVAPPPSTAPLSPPVAEPSPAPAERPQWPTADTPTGLEEPNPFALPPQAETAPLLAQSDHPFAQSPIPPAPIEAPQPALELPFSLSSVPGPDMAGDARLRVPQHEMATGAAQTGQAQIAPPPPSAAPLEDPWSFLPDQPEPSTGVGEGPTRPSTDVSSGGGVKIGADIESLGRILGSSLYSGNITKVAAKELVQNSIDAVRSLGDQGHISVRFMKDGEAGAANTLPFVEVADNGKGMTRQDLETVFTDLGSSGKRDEATASGGFGLAKAAPLLGGDYVEVITTTHEPGQGLITHRFQGSPEDLLRGVPVQSEPAAPGTSTGTLVRTFINKNQFDQYPAKHFVQNIIDHSTGIDAHIALTDSSSKPQTSAQIGSTFRNARLLTTIDDPAADVDILLPQNVALKDTQPRYQVANNGLWQHSRVAGYNSIPGIPERILVNIRPKVAEGDRLYPFTANREDLRGDVESRINKYIKEHITDPAIANQNMRLAEAFRNIPHVQIGNHSVAVYDVGKKFTPQELTQVLATGKVRELITASMKSLDDVLGKLEQKGPAHADVIKRGIIFDASSGTSGYRLYGMLVPNPAVKGQSAILLNVLEAMRDSDTPDNAAAKIHHTLYHEAAHVLAREHNESFTQRLGEVYRETGTSTQVNTLNRILKAYGPDPSQYHPELLDALQIYTESRGRTSNFDDPLRTTGISSEGPASIGGRPSGPELGVGPGAEGAQSVDQAEIPALGRSDIHTIEDLRTLASGQGTITLYHGTTANRAGQILRNGVQLPVSGEAAARAVLKLYDIPWMEWRKIGYEDFGYGQQTKRLSTSTPGVADRWANPEAFPQGEIFSQLNNKARILVEAKRRGVSFQELYDSIPNGVKMGNEADYLGLPDKMAGPGSGGAVLAGDVDVRAVDKHHRQDAQDYLDAIQRGDITSEQAIGMWNHTYKDIKIAPQNWKNVRLVKGLIEDERGSVGGTGLEGFYSRLSKAVERIPEATATKAEGWMNLLRKGGNFTDEEAKWVGLPQWLEERRGQKITGKEVRDFVNAPENRVEVREIHRGGTVGSWTAAKSARLDELEQLAHRRDEFQDREYQQLITAENAATPVPGGQPLITRWGPTSHPNYSLPGAEESKYHEFTFFIPQEAAAQRGIPHGTDSHAFPEQNIVGWTRATERVMPNGKTALNAEEFQGDIHQKGEKEGYLTAEMRAERQARLKRIGAIRARRSEIAHELRVNFSTAREALKGTELRKSLSNEYAALTDEVNQLITENARTAATTPDLPFKRTGMNWEQLQLKAMLREAVKMGKDYLTWTTGEQQSKRYNRLLEDIVGATHDSETVRAVYHPEENVHMPEEMLNGHTRVILKNGSQHSLNDAQQKELFKLLGPERGQQLIERGNLNFRDQPLTLADRGFIAHYDERNVGFMNKYAKQWGAGVEQLPIDTGTNYIKDYEIFQQGDFFGIRRRDNGKVVHSGSSSKASAERTMQSRFASKDAQKVWAIPITPEMRESIIREGQPLGLAHANPLILGGAGAAAGLVLGGSHGDTTEEKVKNALFGATAGLAVGFLGAGAIARAAAEGTGEFGMTKAALFGRTAGALTGALYGGRQGDTPEERIANMLFYGAAGYAGGAMANSKWFANATGTMKDIFVPSSRTPEAQAVAAKLRTAWGFINNRQTMEAMRFPEVEEHFAKQSPRANEAATSAHEKGGSFTGTPDSYSAFYRKSMDEAHRLLNAAWGRKNKVGYIENYVMRKYKFGSAIDEQKGLSFMTRSLSANRSVLRERIYRGSVSEALEAMRAEGINVELAGNPEVLRQWAISNARQAVTYSNLWTQLKTQGFITFKRGLAAPDEGYVALDDRTATKFFQVPEGMVQAGRWTATPDVARILNNAVSRGIRHLPFMAQAFDINNGLNQIQLGFNAFHWIGTAFNAGVSDMSLGTRQLIGGAASGNWARAGQGAWRLAISPIPFASFVKDAVAGKALLEEVGHVDPVAIKFLREVLDPAGGRLATDMRYRTQMWEKMVESFQSGSWGAGAARMPLAVAEKFAHPLMNKAIPRVKLGAFMDLAADIKERMPNASETELRKAYADAWDSIDNRFGQLVYDNLHWNKTMQDIAQLSTRSVGWSLGTIRELGGGIFDATRLRSRGVTDRLLYTAALPAYVAMIGTMYQLLHGAGWPQTSRDYFYPRNGKVDPITGRAVRANMPTYIKDVGSYARHPLATIVGKQSPILQLGVDLWTNQNYMGAMLHNPDDPGLDQALQYGKWFIGNMLPISTQQFRNVHLKDLKDVRTYEPIFGFPRAAATIERSSAEELLHTYAGKDIPQLTPEEAADIKQRTTLKEAITNKDWAVVQEMVQGGQLTDKQLTRMAKQTTLTPLQRGFRDPSLPYEQALRVYEAATPEERGQIKAILAAKGAAALRSLTPEKLQKLIPRFTKAMALPSTTPSR